MPKEGVKRRRCKSEISKLRNAWELRMETTGIKTKRHTLVEIKDGMQRVPAELLT
jgi:hypothetical protein